MFLSFLTTTITVASSGDNQVSWGPLSIAVGVLLACLALGVIDRYAVQQQEPDEHTTTIIHLNNPSPENNSDSEIRELKQELLDLKQTLWESVNGEKSREALAFAETALSREAASRQELLIIIEMLYNLNQQKQNTKQIEAAAALAYAKEKQAQAETALMEQRVQAMRELGKLLQIWVKGQLVLLDLGTVRYLPQQGKFAAKTTDGKKTYSFTLPELPAATYGNDGDDEV